jgi:hypothetical protein
MKLISTSEDSYVALPSYFSFGAQTYILSITSPRVTQISSDEAAIGGIVQRADSYRAVYVSEPIAIIYVKAIDGGGREDPNFLSRLQVSTSISTFDTYDASVPNGLAQSEDTYNFDAQLFATRGRLYFDLRKYATSQVLMKLVNRSGVPLKVRVRVEVYSKDEDIHYRPSEPVKSIQYHAAPEHERVLEHIASIGDKTGRTK